MKTTASSTVDSPFCANFHVDGVIKTKSNFYDSEIVIVLSFVILVEIE